jgi:hypothetical protein
LQQALLKINEVNLKEKKTKAAPNNIYLKWQTLEQYEALKEYNQKLLEEQNKARPKVV